MVKRQKQFKSEQKTKVDNSRSYWSQGKCKTTVRYPHTSIITAKNFKMLTIPSIGDDSEKPDISHTTVRMQNSRRFWKTVWKYLKPKDILIYAQESHSSV